MTLILPIGNDFTALSQLPPLLTTKNFLPIVTLLGVIISNSNVYKSSFTIILYNLNALSGFFVLVIHCTLLTGCIYTW